MLIIREFYKRELEKFHLPHTAIMVKHYMAGLVLIVFGLLVLVWLLFSVYFGMLRPGNTWLIYLNIALFFLNVYTVTTAIRSIRRMRYLIKVSIHLAKMRKLAFDTDPDKFFELEKKLHYGKSSEDFDL